MGARLFMIDRVSEVYVNGVIPDLLAEQLAYEAGKVFYPLNIETDERNKFLRVANYNDIKKRWIAGRDNLLEYFTGDMAVKYIGLMDTAVASESSVNAIIASDPFISTYFSGLYKSYSPALGIRQDIVLPFTGMSLKAAYSCDQQISQVLNDFGSIEIRHAGKLADNRSADDFEQGYNLAISHNDQNDIALATGEYKGLFIINAQSYMIEAAIMHWTLHLTKTKAFNLKLFEIEKSKSDLADSTADQQHYPLTETAKDEKRNSGIFSNFMESLFGK
ncbi:hypothetical protein [Mucilaginibacter sp.]|uniref:hypothetical protein n=1 Tax=Mucilaginibacter sp. TaxID=1882438 RepID=UPI0035BBBED7